MSDTLLWVTRDETKWNFVVFLVILNKLGIYCHIGLGPYTLIYEISTNKLYSNCPRFNGPSTGTEGEGGFSFICNVSWLNN